MSLTKSVQTDNGDSERVGQEELRYEIRKLRKARDSLMVCKQQLDEVRHLVIIFFLLVIDMLSTKNPKT